MKRRKLGKTDENRNLYLRFNTFWVAYTGRDGKRCFHSTKTNDIVKAREIRDAWVAGKGPERAELLTVDQAVQRYLQERQERGEKLPDKVKITLKDDAVVLARFAEFIGKDRILRDIDDADLDGFDEWLVAKYPKITSVHRRNRHFKILHVFFNRCVRKRRMKINPVAPFLEELDEEAKRDRYLSIVEYLRLLKACADPDLNPQLRPIIEVLAITGLRVADALSIAWVNVDYDKREIVIPVQRKRHNRHTVPMGARLEEILRAIPANPDIPWVFHHKKQRVSQKGWLRVQFAKAKMRAGLKDIRLHDLRRSMATHAADDSAQNLIQQALGHASSAMTGRYIQPKIDNLRRVQDALVSRLYDDEVLQVVLQSTPKEAPPRQGVEAKEVDIQLPDVLGRWQSGQMHQTVKPSTSPTETYFLDGNTTSSTLSENVTKGQKDDPV